MKKLALVEHDGKAQRNLRIGSSAAAFQNPPGTPTRSPAIVAPMHMDDRVVMDDEHAHLGDLEKSQSVSGRSGNSTGFTSPSSMTVRAFFLYTGYSSQPSRHPAAIMGRSLPFPSSTKYIFYCQQGMSQQTERIHTRHTTNEQQRRQAVLEQSTRVSETAESYHYRA
eukprot:GHVU01181168.1.p1 GENE.GHVU01181168.1~~GHVU01181168.1.p1  ORF type:complete len:167 (-),score=12.79 GHVU01181168.1:78-578(-)